MTDTCILSSPGQEGALCFGDSPAAPSTTLSGAQGHTCRGPGAGPAVPPGGTHVVCGGGQRPSEHPGICEPLGVDPVCTAAQLSLGVRPPGLAAASASLSPRPPPSSTPRSNHSAEAKCVARSLQGPCSLLPKMPQGALTRCPTATARGRAREPRCPHGAPWAEDLRCGARGNTAPQEC
ncbi:unnamed protein product [Rangifer tarandus platyrhynchus]|uniref:Uncharacterized protein n=2 Tax=Rangifer tarandus platyrhynchus TaxID=3082113 RepID=A0ACB0EPV9_RANTA|nr:unnamed protein product [Rangifer tarandus platyrhynchus]CAI9702387.1 unnamed protein product [Rangifer tarandus platyrhynchus]